MSINLLLLRFTKGSSRKYFLSSCLSCFLPTEFKLLNLGQISYSYSVLQSSRISVLSKRLSSATEACIEGLTRPGLRSMSSKNMSTSNNVSLNEEVVETGIDVEDVPKEDKQRRSKRKQKQLKKIRPKKIEKFRNDKRYDETSYYFKDGFRCVEPYIYTFECHIKGRWYGRKVLEVCKKEFRSEAKDFYEKAIAVGLLTINGERVSHDRLLHSNEILRSRVHRHEPPVTNEPIKIIHSDEEVVVVDKPPSIPVHPCGKYRHNSLVFILGKEYGFTGLHTIHRLDRLTSGLLIFARTTEVSKKLDTYVRNRELEKTYVCKVKGQFPSEPIVCEEPIFVVSHKIGVCRVSPQGKECRTQFERISYDGETSILKCIPHTGRMHQIRVHLQYLGYPITNDPLYNNMVWGSDVGKGDSSSGMSDEVLIQKLIIQHDEDLLERLVEDHRQSHLESSAEASEDDKTTVENPLKRHDRGTDEIKEDNIIDKDLLPSTKKIKYETVKEMYYDNNTRSDKRTEETQNMEGIKSESVSSIGGVEKSASSSIETKEENMIDEDLLPSTKRIKCDETLKAMDVEKSSSALVEDSECLPDGTLNMDKLLPPDVVMKREGETEEERLNRLVMMFCQDCKLKYRDPKESEMRIYLHALRYKGPDFDYSTEMPSWAQEHIDKCKEKSN
ncbi:RNA pseudouridylate synthase domain-containing protein 2-like isoform X2 [Anneissia japonica]|uniref:RNA pseudouridylate synthase domain-containing protein 2-like isoform X2 n=1 Tax=Anneissia japonica TaxID=1529436 RepID=UPI001425B7D5|nr:RNA pseudouridylate synthase domain-containing protein 2-like isoform X2 [Anneissia japonica]